VRDDSRLRALMLALGLIPPRSMSTPGERDLLAELASDARRVIEIGVYEGASAVRLCDAMRPDAELHLIDPFGEHLTALRRGWHATEWASRRVVERAAASGPRVVWHVKHSDLAVRGWRVAVDLVFVDGDHTEEACELDWNMWHPFVAPGGHVVFHDARSDQPGGWGLPGPTAVVRRLREQPPPGWTIAAERDSMVAVRRELSAP
jgi:predicted O-methyltransferase YrrM